MNTIKKTKLLVNRKKNRTLKRKTIKRNIKVNTLSIIDRLQKKHNALITKTEYDKLNFPHLNKFITKEDIVELGDYIRKQFKPRILHKPQDMDIIKKFRDNKHMRPIRQLNNKIWIIEEDYYKYYVINKITDYFSQNCRAVCIGKNKSDYQLFQTHKEKIYQQLKNKLSYMSIMDYLYNYNNLCTNFNVSIMLALLNIFKPKVWIDISCGWGDRLIAATLYPKLEKYLGSDPSECMKPNYNKIIDTLDPKNRRKYTVLNRGYEDTNWVKESADFIFSSPPFFDLEIYEDKSKQSHIKYNNFDKWFHYFLCDVVVKKSVYYLQPKGFFGLYISDYKNYKYESKTIQHIKETYNNMIYIGKIYFYTKPNKKAIRHIHFWQKIHK